MGEKRLHCIGRSSSSDWANALGIAEVADWSVSDERVFEKGQQGNRQVPETQSMAPKTHLRQPEAAKLRARCDGAFPNTQMGLESRRSEAFG